MYVYIISEVQRLNLLIIFYQFAKPITHLEGIRFLFFRCQTHEDRMEVLLKGANEGHMRQ